jgi:hypothetical protein
MSRRGIHTALTDRLLTINLPKAWLNQDFDPSADGNLPYLSVEMIRSGTSDDTLDGEAPIQTGRLIVTVVAQGGTGSGAADDHADTIAALYPMGDRIAATTGETITILQPPHIREGIADGSYWRVPVSVSFQAA